MIIKVNGKLAVVKSGTSFDYTVENRLFNGRDGYTLSISFPLNGCEQNRAIFGYINRMDVEKMKAVYDCEIRDREFVLYGSLVAVSISDSEVKCQFVSGRSEDVVKNLFEGKYINELDLGRPATTSAADLTPREAWRGDEIAIPWVNKKYPLAPNNWVNFYNDVFVWASPGVPLSFQPRLITIAERICQAIGYEYDFTEWENSKYWRLFIFNSLPGTWEKPDYATALPHWTVSEFFEKLELLLMCEFDFDHRARTVKFNWTNNIIKSQKEVKIDNVIDEYSADISDGQNGSKCDYIGKRVLKYKECEHSMHPYYDCPWFLKGQKWIVEVKDLDTLIEKMKPQQVVLRDGKTVTVYGGYGEDAAIAYDIHWVQQYDIGRIFHAQREDTYFVLRSIASMAPDPDHFRDHPQQVYVLTPINMFGSETAGDIEDNETTEIEFVPVCVDDTYISDADDRGFMACLDPSDFESESSEQDEEESWQPGPARAILAGEKEKAEAYYDVIYVGFWTGTTWQEGKPPFPQVDPVVVTQDWHGFVDSNIDSLRLVNAKRSANTKIPQLNPLQKFKFSWLDNKIPNPRAIFNIRGQRYICEKITAAFTENGMSRKLKGEFYPLEEDYSAPSNSTIS